LLASYRFNLSQIEDYLAKHPEPMWFAQGETPTAADFMMLFVLEALASEQAGLAGRLDIPHIKNYVKVVHARYAYLMSFELWAPGTDHPSTGRRTRRHVCLPG
jgi:glutathione S-transferase